MALGCWRNGETALSPKSVPLEGPHPFRKRPLETFLAAFLYGECCNQSSMSAKAFGKGGMGSAPMGLGKGKRGGAPPFLQKRFSHLPPRLFVRERYSLAVPCEKCSVALQVPRAPLQIL